MRSRRLILGLTASVATVLVWACDSETTAPHPVSTLETFVIALNGASERPAARVTSATGVAVLQVIDENTLSFAV
ncbi:MAG: hypothetical protein ABI877_19165, partial [Gemmatimonadaceae bacterium]